MEKNVKHDMETRVVRVIKRFREREHPNMVVWQNHRVSLFGQLLKIP